MQQDLQLLRGAGTKDGSSNGRVRHDLGNGQCGGWDPVLAGVGSKTLGNLIIDRVLVPLDIEPIIDEPPWPTWLSVIIWS